MSVIDRVRWQRASGHLDQVLDLPADEREVWLTTLRADDPESADDVEALLAEHRLLSAEGFLESVAPERPSAAPLEGFTIGAYTVVSPIGHGGMGTVWRARRSDGRFEGQAALKLLSAALVGRAGEERFKREGTILARLTHPHIARLIDAGVTATGQPYLVLEDIEGRHIDRYCDEERLGIEERIRLFLDVQAAVAHAHANLIVHRDLKPSNVLVTGDGRVKLLDFGIAKLIEGNAVEPSPPAALTVDGGQVLTPKYAAPEQVLNGRITTATDVYALGVLLFEVLSGGHPSGLVAGSAAEFLAAASSEPRRLSAAVSGSAAPGLTAARAESRATTPERLRRVLRGDLDTILITALKIDPAERYDSVAAFADDLRRFLDHQPIRARPDALGYRAARFVRRNRTVVAAAALGAVLAIGLVAFYTVQLTAERDRARSQADKATKVSELLTGLLTRADPYRTPDGSEPTLQSLLDVGAERTATDLGGQPDVQAQLFTVIGRTYQRMGQTDRALPLLEEALTLGRRTLGPEHPRVAQSLNDLGVLYRQQGRLAEAEGVLRESLAVRRRVLGSGDKDLAVTLVELARVFEERGRSNDGEPHIREALAIRRALFGEEHRETATSKNELGLFLLRRGDLAGAEPLLRENVATNLRILGPDHPNTVAAKGSLASLLMAGNQAAAAEALLRESLEVRGRVFGTSRPEYAQTLGSLAAAVELQGRLAEAQALLEESLRIAAPQLGDDHPRVLTLTLNLARVRIAQGDAAPVESPLRRVLAARQRLYPAGDWRIGEAQSLLGAALLAQSRYRDAEPLLLAADETIKAVPGPQARARNSNRQHLAALYAAAAGPLPAQSGR